VANRGRVVAIAGMAAVGAGAVLIAPFWAIDVSVLTFASLVISYYCMRKLELPNWLWVKPPVVRSRLFSYTQVAKANETAASRGEGPPLKGGVFSATELRNLPREELSKLEAKLRDAE
jgi:hypothetical protein